MLLKSYLITRLALYLPDQDNHSQFQGSVLQSKSTTSEGGGTKVQETFWFFAELLNVQTFVWLFLMSSFVEDWGANKGPAKYTDKDENIKTAGISCFNSLFSTCDGTLSIEDIVMSCRQLSCTDVSKINSRKYVTASFSTPSDLSQLIPEL